MAEERQANLVHDTFANVNAHKLSSDIIRRHSSNTEDIRQVALEPLDLLKYRRILDLGCGYGFFTEALKDRLHPDASILGIDVLPENETPYLDTCRRAGLRGSFRLQDVIPLKTFAPGTFDLILCSYALYFFPQAIGTISQLLKQNGCFVTITHGRDTMIELIGMVKRLLRDKGKLDHDQLPIETIIGRFCSENGERLLGPAFRRIDRIDYCNTLHFSPDEISALGSYFRFKGAFFLSETQLDKNEIADMLMVHLQDGGQQGIAISKNDTVFICSDPKE